MGHGPGKRPSAGRAGKGKVVGSRQMGHDSERGEALYPAVGYTCNIPHPRLTERRAGVVVFLTCDRPPGHRLQHRAKTRAGYVWWS